MYGLRFQRQARGRTGAICTGDCFFEVSQSITIGEAQHAVGSGLWNEGAIAQLGAVIDGTDPVRGTNDEITVFDGTGVWLQDIAVAEVAAKRAAEEDATAVTLSTRFEPQFSLVRWMDATRAPWPCLV